ncbi:MAG: hypothetical protein P8Z00_25205, partial [Anaerolineales bacterium]
QLSSEIATAEIGVVNGTCPQLHWETPVGDGERYKTPYSKIKLCVKAQDDLAVKYVEFYRWDYEQEIHVFFARIYEPPYCTDLDTRDLLPDWNQVYARAYDDSGNGSPSNFIWIILDPIYPVRVYLPSVWSRGGS